MTKPLREIPVLRSVLSAKVLADLVSHKYLLDDVRLQLVKALILDTYIVTTRTERYILRIYPAHRRSGADVSGELAFLMYLQAAGLPVSTPVPHKNGGLWFEVDAPEGTRRGALFTFAVGEALPADTPLETIQTIGWFTAHVHRVADVIGKSLPRPALDINSLLRQPIKALQDPLSHRKNDYTALKTLVENYLVPQISVLETSAPTYGLIHGDLNRSNIHTTADGQIHMFDFDFCGPGWRVYDIGTFLHQEPEDVQEAFILGYQELRPLSPQELATIPLMQAAHSVWLLGMRASYINEWGSVYFDDDFIDGHLALIEEFTLSAINDQPTVPTRVSTHTA